MVYGMSKESCNTSCKGYFKFFDFLLLWILNFLKVFRILFYSVDFLIFHSKSKLRKETFSYIKTFLPFRPVQSMLLLVYAIYNTLNKQTWYDYPMCTYNVNTGSQHWMKKKTIINWVYELFRIHETRILIGCFGLKGYYFLII